MTPPALPPCEDVAALVTQVETAVLDGRQEEVQALVSRTEAAFACGELADPTALAHLLLVQGVWLSLGGEKGDAKAAFVTAHSIQADVWDPKYGATLQAEYDAAVAGSAGTIGQITIEPATEGFRTALDGKIVAFPVTTTAGFHLVQVLDPKSGPSRFARLSLLGAGESLVVNTGPLTHAPKTGRGFPVWLAAGVGTGLLAGGGMLMAWRETGIMETATTQADLDSHFARQKVYTYGSYGLAGLAATGVTLQFVL